MRGTALVGICCVLATAVASVGLTMLASTPPKTSGSGIEALEKRLATLEAQVRSLSVHAETPVEREATGSPLPPMNESASFAPMRTEEVSLDPITDRLAELEKVTTSLARALELRVTNDPSPIPKDVVAIRVLVAAVQHDPERIRLNHLFWSPRDFALRYGMPDFAAANVWQYKPGEDETGIMVVFDHGSFSMMKLLEPVIQGR